MAFLQLALLAADRKLFDLRDLGRGLRFVWGKRGFVRVILPQLKAFYRADFHPWTIDNRELIPAWMEGHSTMSGARVVGTRAGEARGADEIVPVQEHLARHHAVDAEMGGAAAHGHEVDRRG